MIITYKDGQQIVECESGQHVIYTEQDLAEHKKFLESEIVSLNNEVIRMDLEIAEIKNSMGT